MLLAPSLAWITDHELRVQVSGFTPGQLSEFSRKQGPSFARHVANNPEGEHSVFSGEQC
jgi:hypothetical protein